MARPIDADALKQECMYIDGIPVVTEHDIDNAPTINAISVKWLENKELDYRTIGDKMFSDTFALVIGEWQKEQEVR